MNDLKALIQSSLKSIPQNELTASDDIVHRSDVEAQLKKIEEKTEFCNKLLKYERPDELLNDYSIEAARQLVMEVKYGKQSQDRIKASQIVLDRALGKPIDRIMNINMEINNMKDEEMDHKINELLSELGFSKGQTKKLMQE